MRQGQPLGTRGNIEHDHPTVLDHGLDHDGFRATALAPAERCYSLHHRLDVRGTYYTNFWGTDWAFYIDVINAYNRKNVLGYDYYLKDGLYINRNVVGMFPILPTIGINAKF